MTMVKQRGALSRMLHGNERLQAQAFVGAHCEAHACEDAEAGRRILEMPAEDFLSTLALEPDEGESP